MLLLASSSLLPAELLLPAKLRLHRRPLHLLAKFLAPRRVGGPSPTRPLLLLWYLLELLLRLLLVLPTTATPPAAPPALLGAGTGPLTPSRKNSRRTVC